MVLEVKTIIGGIGIMLASIFIAIPNNQPIGNKVSKPYSINFDKLEQIDNTKTLIIDSLTFKIAMEKIELEQKYKVVTRSLNIERKKNEMLKDTIRHHKIIDTLID